jgi:hypothetical protein
LPIAPGAPFGHNTTVRSNPFGALVGVAAHTKATETAKRQTSLAKKTNLRFIVPSA